MFTHKGTQTMETERLILRKARQEDVRPLYENWASDPEVTRYLTWPTYTGMEMARERIAFLLKECEKEDVYEWMIEYKPLGQPIGSIAVVTSREAVEKMEIGYCIGRPWWHQGITSEALRAVLEFLFTQVGASRIEAHHDVQNPHSGGVMAKCGMVFEGIHRSDGRNNQGICDVACYAILKEDWAAGRG